jgi:hypothetical protein
MFSIGAAFDRLSSREKVLVSTMVGLFVLIIFGGGWFWLSSDANALESRLAEEQKALEKIYAASSEYLSAVRQTETMRERAERNAEMNLKLEVNHIAKGISFDARDRSGNVEGSKRLSDVIQFDQTQETYLSRKRSKKKRKGKKKDAQVGYFRKDQPVTLSDKVDFDAIYKLLEGIEDSDELIFVTDIEMSRDFQDGQVARKNASFVVSTYFYRGEE